MMGESGFIPTERRFWRLSKKSNSLGGQNSKFGKFTVTEKKKRIGRNPKTKESKIISGRKVVLFKPSKHFKDFLNIEQNEQI